MFASHIGEQKQVNSSEQQELYVANNNFQVSDQFPHALCLCELSLITIIFIIIRMNSS